jgi:hypothetical protein
LFINLYGETTEKVPSPHIFHNIGWNLLNFFTCNYGFNFLGAGGATFGMIKTGLDWRWRNTVFDNEWLAKPGGLVMSTDGIVPLVTPLAFYLSGIFLKDKKFKIAAAALTQTLILTMAVQGRLK